MSRRAFNENERQILYRAAGGRCQKCGRELHGVFHADHIKPFSLGGKTDVINGQALCEECNQVKSNRYASLPGWEITLRDWQQRAIERYYALNKRNFIAVATPASGKTTFCLKVIHSVLSDGIAKRVAIVAPTDYLRDQWATEAAKVGIELVTVYDAEFQLAPDQHGIVTTYQSVAARHETAKAYRKFTADEPTIAIFDEIHHVGESLIWGKALLSAFEPAVKRLGVSGTLWRTMGDDTIPFVAYVNGACAPDFTYSYAEALGDGIVRPVYFQTYEGDLSWFSQDELHTATFADDLSEGRSRERLNAAISTQGNWLRQVMRESHARLMETRVDDPNAAHLLVAKDTFHAEVAAELLSSIVGQKVPVATTRVDEARAIIEQFRSGRDPWLVTVKMVSEGVDIPRLRGGIYATNITTELFFRQVVARAMRGGDGNDAWWSIPKDPSIAAYALSMKKERNHVLDDNREEILDEIYQAERERGERQPSSFQVVETSAEIDSVIADDETYEPVELARAGQLAREAGLGIVNPVLILKLLHLAEQQTRGEAPHIEHAKTGKMPTLEQQKKALTKGGGLIRTSLASLVEASNGTLSYSDINRALNQAQEVRTQKECTLDQLAQRVHILEAWNESYRNGTWREFTPQRYLREHARAGT